jgi:hypothetical protein
MNAPSPRAALRALFVLTACALLAPLTLAQTALTGTVTNAATGRALEGARVTIEGTSREVITDSGGNFRFDDLAPGSVSLSVYYTGLDPARASVTVSAGSANRRDFGLTSGIYKMANARAMPRPSRCSGSPMA